MSQVEVQEELNRSYDRSNCWYHIFLPTSSIYRQGPSQASNTYQMKMFQVNDTKISLPEEVWDSGSGSRVTKSLCETFGPMSFDETRVTEFRYGARLCCPIYSGQSLIAILL